MKYYIYAHVPSQGGDPFYVGKGSNRRAWSEKGRSKDWAHVASSGYEVKILAYTETSREALITEKAIIGALSLRGVELVNKNGGGGGSPKCVHTEEFKRKMSKIHSGKKLSSQHKVNLSRAMSGVPKSEEHKKRLSEAVKAYWAAKKASLG